MKKVLLIIAFEGFQPKEYGEPKRILVSGGVDIKTASDKKGIAISAYTNTEVEVDLNLDEVEVGDYNGVFMVGGPGALEHLDNEKIYKIMTDAKENRKLWGAICISPRILAKAGILKNKKATGWNLDNELEGILKTAGAEYIDKKVVVDGNLITGNGPEAAEEFGKVILENL